MLFGAFCSYLLTLHYLFLWCCICRFCHLLYLCWLQELIFPLGCFLPLKYFPTLFSAPVCKTSEPVLPFSSHIFLTEWPYLLSQSWDLGNETMISSSVSSVTVPLTSSRYASIDAQWWAAQVHSPSFFPLFWWSSHSLFPVCGCPVAFLGWKLTIHPSCPLISYTCALSHFWSDSSFPILSSFCFP